MYLPNVREKVITPLFVGTKGDNGPRENAYYEGYMDERGRAELIGYDWAVECLENALYLAGVGEKKRESILTIMECDRNDMVVSIIESMDEDEYAAAVAVCKEREEAE